MKPDTSNMKNGIMKYVLAACVACCVFGGAKSEAASLSLHVGHGVNLRLCDHRHVVKKHHKEVHRYCRKHDAHADRHHNKRVAAHRKDCREHRR